MSDESATQQGFVLTGQSQKSPFNKSRLLSKGVPFPPL